MSASQLASLQHPPEVVVSFVRELMDGHQRVVSDRRFHPRNVIELPAVVQPLDFDFQPAGQLFIATTKDVSTGGVALIHTDQVTAPYLQIEFATQEAKAMSLLAKVIHCTPYGQHFHVGARFVVDWSRWRSNTPQHDSNGGSASDIPSDTPVEERETRQ